MAPLRTFQSIGLMPVARTAIRTWPASGCGSGSSTTSNTSGPPNRLNWTAFIAPRKGYASAPASSRALANTASIISSVSRPVNVFCWLGW